MSAEVTPLLGVEDLVVRFALPRMGWRGAAREITAVDGVSLSVARSETLGLVGESGSGKSTIARAALQLVPVRSGTVRFDGQVVTRSRRGSLTELRRRAQMVFQDPQSSLNPRHTVDEIIREPLEIHGVGDRAWRSAQVARLLDQVGLPAAAVERYPHQFSGGQQQRIGIARALALEPSLIVCDEPVAALDVSVQAQILSLLEDIQKRMAVAYLFIAHDLMVVRHISDRTAVMYLGGIVEEGPTRTVFAGPRHPYTQALLSSVPIPDPDLERARPRMVLQGEIADASDPPSGCRFRTRCPYVRERCASERPTLEIVSPGHRVACHFWSEIAALQVRQPGSRGLPWNEDAQPVANSSVSTSTDPTR